MARRGSRAAIDPAFITAVGNAGVADADDLLQSYLDLFTDVDRDLSGEIDIKELRLSDVIAARVRDQGKTMDQLQRLFLLVDSDGNCKLDPREFLNLMLLLEDRIQTPIDPDGPVVDQTRAKLHLRVAITPSGEDFLLRVQCLQLHQTAAAKVDLKINLFPTIPNRNTPMQQALKSPSAARDLMWDTICMWAIPHTEDLAPYRLSISAFKHKGGLLGRIKSSKSFLGGMTLALSEIGVGKDTDAWYSMLDPRLALDGSLVVDDPTK